MLALETLRGCDIIHIDGGHGEEQFRVDFAHALMLPLPPSATRHILVDDSIFPFIRSLVIAHINRGYVASETYGGFWHGGGNAAILLRVLRSHE
jgi:hypothetical protein